MQPSATRDEGQAMVVALGIMLVLSIAVVAVIVLSSAAGRGQTRENAHNAALSVAEAGVANGLSLLSNSPFPLSPSTLPGAGSPQVDPVGDGTASWYGTLAGDTWTITATSSVPNPSGGAPLTRTVNVAARVGSTAVNPAWNYVFSNSGACLTLDNTVHITEPLYTRGGLCTNQSALVDGSPVQVEGTIQTTGS